MAFDLARCNAALVSSCRNCSASKACVARSNSIVSATSSSARCRCTNDSAAIAASDDVGEKNVFPDGAVAFQVVEAGDDEPFFRFSEEEPDRKRGVKWRGLVVPPLTANDGDRGLMGTARRGVDDDDAEAERDSRGDDNNDLAVVELFPFSINCDPEDGETLPTPLMERPLWRGRNRLTTSDAARAFLRASSISPRAMKADVRASATARSRSRIMSEAVVASL